MTASTFDLRPEVAAALMSQKPVVALESTLISHGLPWPTNLETAREAESAIRSENAVPATIAVIDGRPTIGLNETELEKLAQNRNVVKASRRDLAAVITQRQTAGTSVAATMFLAREAGIRVFATGGIGGAHRGESNQWDISADLTELARTAVAVVCSGAKNILDIPRTLEILETYGVPVVGFGTGDFPAFYARSSGQPVGVRVNTSAEAADLISAHWSLKGAGVVIAQPVCEEAVLSSEVLESALEQAERDAVDAGVRGSALTPFLLSRLAELTGGQTLRANQALVVANARLAAQIASHLC